MPTLKEEILLSLEERVFFLLNPYIYLKYASHYSQKSIYTTVRRLEKRGLIRKFQREGKKHLKLTELGKAVLEKHRADSKKHRPPWDQKWRLVIFDVPESKTELRKYLRTYLITMGFGKVQRSVWISPYDYRIEVKQYLKKIKLSDFVYQLLVENFQGLTGEEIATTFWDLQGLHNKYVKFCRDWTERLSKLEDIRQESTEPDADIFQRYMSHLTWDYQAILSQDPHLPMELLPSDWGGTSAKKFVEKCKRNPRGKNFK